MDHKESSAGDAWGLLALLGAVFIAGVIVGMWFSEPFFEWLSKVVAVDGR